MPYVYNLCSSYRSGREVSAGAIATFNVDHKSSKELRQYLANIADQCENTAAGELPNVIILDNLHHVTSLGEVGVQVYFYSKISHIGYQVEQDNSVARDLPFTVSVYFNYILSNYKISQKQI